MTNFEFDDFDTQVSCEEYYTEPTASEIQEMLAGADYTAFDIIDRELDWEYAMAEWNRELGSKFFPFDEREDA